MKLPRPALLQALFLLACGSIGALHALPLRAQSAPPAAQADQPPTPQWEIDASAGGKLEFDVASVKQDTAQMSPTTTHTNVVLGPQNVFTPTNGVMESFNYPLVTFIGFAYKLGPADVQALQMQLPKWAANSRYDIEARAPGNPTKDQYRLMVRAMLADRFQLAIHYETKQTGVDALVFDKPGKFGPQFRPHPSDATCSNLVPPPVDANLPTIEGGYPEVCSGVQLWPSKTAGRFRMGGRNVNLAMMASQFSIGQLTGADRPVVDKTDLTGTFDFVMEFTPQIEGPLPPGGFQPDPTGPTFLEALKEQLGLKLESQKSSVTTLTVDHIEEPTPN